MAEDSSNDAPKAESFSAREMEIMAKAWFCMDGEPKVNYNTLAEACGFTNVGSASNAWSKIKKKLNALNAGMKPATPNGKGDEEESTPATKATTGKKRGRKPKDEDGETSSKKPRGKGKNVKAEEIEVDVNGEQVEE